MPFGAVWKRSVAKVAVETARLVLRDWDYADEDRFYAVMNSPSVMRHLGGVQSPEEWNAAYLRIRGFSRDFGHTFWIIEDKATGDIQGFCGLKRVNAPGAGELMGTPEIGWRLRESAWGKGIAKEAAIASLDIGFSRFAYERIIALTIAANHASQGLMKRLGMKRREELDFIDQRFGAEMNPQIIFEMRAANWAESRAAALA